MGLQDSKHNCMIDSHVSNTGTSMMGLRDSRHNSMISMHIQATLDRDKHERNASRADDSKKGMQRQTQQEEQGPL